MKYTLTYPDAKHRDEPAPGLVYLDRLMDCFVCRDQTHFADIALGVAVCSPTCALTLEKDRASHLQLPEPWAQQSKRAA